MIQTDDLDKPLAERCDQFNRLVEVKTIIYLSKTSLSIIPFRKGKKNKN
jgi:hypothetical protein